MEIIKEAEDVININYNRTIGTSLAYLLTGDNFYDIQKCGKIPKNIDLSVTKNKLYRLGDNLFKKKFNSRKLDPKYEVKTKKITQIRENGY